MPAVNLTAGPSLSSTRIFLIKQAKSYKFPKTVNNGRFPEGHPKGDYALDTTEIGVRALQNEATCQNRAADQHLVLPVVHVWLAGDAGYLAMYVSRLSRARNLAAPWPDSPRRGLAGRPCTASTWRTG